MSYLTKPLVFHQKIPARFRCSWALMFLPPQSGLAGARVSFMYHLLVNRKKASRWCSRIYTLAFGGTARYNSGAHTPMVSGGWGCRQPPARLEQGASHGWAVTGVKTWRGGIRELGISRPVAACVAHVGARPALAEGVMLLLCLSLRWLSLPSSAFSSSICSVVSHWRLHTW